MAASQPAIADTEVVVMVAAAVPATPRSRRSTLPMPMPEQELGSAVMVASHPAAAGAEVATATAVPAKPLPRQATMPVPAPVLGSAPAPVDGPVVQVVAATPGQLDVLSGHGRWADVESDSSEGEYEVVCGAAAGPDAWGGTGASAGSWGVPRRGFRNVDNASCASNAAHVAVTASPVLREQIRRRGDGHGLHRAVEYLYGGGRHGVRSLGELGVEEGRSCSAQHQDAGRGVYDLVTAEPVVEQVRHRVEVTDLRRRTPEARLVPNPTRVVVQASVQLNLAAIRETGSLVAALQARSGPTGLPTGGARTRAVVCTLPSVLVVLASRVDAAGHTCTSPVFEYPTRFPAATLLTADGAAADVGDRARGTYVLRAVVVHRALMSGRRLLRHPPR